MGGVLLAAREEEVEVEGERESESESERGGGGIMALIRDSAVCSGYRGGARGKLDTHRELDITLIIKGGL